MPPRGRLFWAPRLLLAKKPPRSLQDGPRGLQEVLQEGPKMPKSRLGAFLGSLGGLLGRLGALLGRLGALLEAVLGRSGELLGRLSTENHVFYDVFCSLNTKNTKTTCFWALSAGNHVFY